MMSVMKNALEGAFDRNSFENSKKTRNEDICFKDFDTPSVLHVIRNNEVFGDFWINGSIEMTTLINQVIFIRNKVIHCSFHTSCRLLTTAHWSGCSVGKGEETSLRNAIIGRFEL